MVEKINKFFAKLAKVHAVTYMIILGLCAAMLYAYLSEPQVHKIWLERIKYFGIFILIFNPFITRCFYEKYELGRKYLPTTNSGWVKKDTYFLTKISSSIALPKKTLGYLYVIIRIAHAGFIGFVLAVIPILWIKNALGFKAW